MVTEAATLLRLDEARERMLTSIAPLGAARLPLLDCLGRVLAEPVDALLTLPPWDNSAMDGFAVRAADVIDATVERPVRLRVVGDVPAGHAPSVSVEGGAAARVLTGALMPPGADSVVPVEETDAPPGLAEAPAEVAVHRPAARGAHVRAAGSDVHAGERLIEAGAVVGPAGVAVAAAVGHAALSVHARPRVAILSTGDELVPVGEPLPPAGIHDSNAVGLAAQAASAGAEVIPLGIAQDRHHAVRERLEEGIRRADVVLASGGVSVGAHDVVKDAFADLGTLELWRVAVQPGKPLAFGRADRPGGGTALFFGLPGNPVSSYVTFELFVRPVLRRLAGHAAPSHRRTVRAALATPVSKAPGRRAFLRVTLARDLDRPEGWLATLAGGQGSHVLSALARADGLAVVPEEVEALPAGSVVEVILLEASED